MYEYPKQGRESLPERPGDLDGDAVLRTRSTTNNFPKRLDEHTIVIVDHLGAREVHFPLDEGAVFHMPILPLIEHEGVPLRGTRHGHRARAAGRPAPPRW